MPGTCPECGAPIPIGGMCRENLYALLFLEGEIPGGPGMLAHFYAIASYGLQHPDSMNYTAETLAGLRKALDDALEGRAKIHDLRQRARRASKSTGRITRRAGDTEVLWRRGHWPMTVADVLSVEKNAGAYADRVLLWARSVREALDENQK